MRYKGNRRVVRRLDRGAVLRDLPCAADEYDAAGSNVNHDHGACHGAEADCGAAAAAAVAAAEAKVGLDGSIWICCRRARDRVDAALGESVGNRVAKAVELMRRIECIGPLCLAYALKIS